MSRPGPIQESMIDCPTCDGSRRVDVQHSGTIEGGPCWESTECSECFGAGKVLNVNLCT
jgi:hypothetical protein